MLLRKLSASALALSTLVLGCEDEMITIQENVDPTAVIEAPLEVGLSDLVRFDASMSKDSDGRIVSYQWDFGDGVGTAPSAEAFYTYNALGEYTVTLTVVDNREGSATATHQITVLALPENQPPNARIDAPFSTSANVPVTLSGLMSSDPDGEIVNYEWTISAAGGEMGPTVRGTEVSHTFTADGSYDITLKVVDNRGLQATASHTIEVGSTDNLPPVANPGTDMTVGLGQTFTLDGSNSFDPDGNIVSYQWDFGDGATAMGAMASHTYNVESSFPVTLTVTDDGGLMSSATINVTVGVTEVGGTYTMEATPSTGSCGGLPATFVATTVTFTAMGSALVATQPDPENPGAPDIPMNGTLSGPNFTVSGTWSDSSGGDHQITFSGSFSGTSYAGIFQESINFAGIPLCDLMWNVTGSRL